MNSEIKTVKVGSLNLTSGSKINPNMTRQSSEYDEARHSLKEPGDFLEGFESISKASACAARMRNVWSLPIKSYKNLATGAFGVVYKETDEAEEGVILNQPPSNDVLHTQFMGRPEEVAAQAKEFVKKLDEIGSRAEVSGLTVKEAIAKAKEQRESASKTSAEEVIDKSIHPETQSEFPEVADNPPWEEQSPTYQ